MHGSSSRDLHRAILVFEALWSAPRRASSVRETKAQSVERRFQLTMNEYRKHLRAAVQEDASEGSAPEPCRFCGSKVTNEKQLALRARAGVRRMVVVRICANAACRSNRIECEDGP